MRQGFIAAALGVAALFAVSSVQAAAAPKAAPAAAFPKIAVVDLQAVVTNCQRGKDAIVLLKQEKAKLQPEADDRQAKVKALKDQLDKMTDSKSSDYQKLLSQYQDAQSQLDQYTKEASAMLEQHQEQMFGPIRDELIGKVLGQYVQENHVDILLSRNLGAAMYSTPAYDISAAVVAAMDKDWAETQKAAAAAPTAAPAATTKH